MKYSLVLSGKFKRSLKLARKRGLDIDLLDTVVNKLLQGIPLAPKYKDHPLSGIIKVLESVTFNRTGYLYIL